MLRLLKQENVAILLVSELASSPDHLISLAHIAKRHGVSLLFLKKLALQLREAGLIKSKEGVGGGYRLSRDAKSISILDCLKALQKHKTPEISGNRKCPLHPDCLPHVIRSTLGKRIFESLAAISLYDLIYEKT